MCMQCIFSDLEIVKKIPSTVSTYLYLHNIQAHIHTYKYLHDKKITLEYLRTFMQLSRQTYERYIQDIRLNLSKQTAHGGICFLGCNGVYISLTIPYHSEVGAKSFLASQSKLESIFMQFEICTRKCPLHKYFPDVLVHTNP